MMRCFLVTAWLTALAGLLPAQLPYRIEGTHADLSIQYSAGHWGGGVALDVALPQYNNQTFIPPNQARLAVNNSATTRAAQPAGGNFGFIGAGAGNTFWRLSQNNLTPNQLFLGLSTNGMGSQAPGQGWASWNPAAVSVNPGAPNVNSMLVEYVIEKVHTPRGGEFSAWFTSGGTPRVYASTFERGTESDANSLFVPIDGHIHQNWGFSKPGRYKLEMTARTFYFDSNGILTELRSDPLNPFVFTFDVGKHRPLPTDSLNIYVGLPRPAANLPVPEPSLCLGIGSILCLFAIRRRQCNNEV